MMNKYFVGPDHFVFENVLVMKYTPRNLGAHIRSRVNSSLLYVIEGCYRYTVGDEVFDICGGEVAYIPRGAEYSYAVMSESVQCIQVEFDLYRHADGKWEPIRFFDTPVRVSSDEEAKQLFEALAGRYFGDSFMTLSVLYHMMSLFFGEADSIGVGNADKRKVRPALEYIRKHFRSKISVPELAALCGLSTPHFRRIFKSYTGKSPVRYKNAVLMEHACNMLGSGAMNVSEVADALGFPDIYTFSQTFKREIGVSPNRYIPQKEGQASVHAST